ncbi:MAG: RNA methyltransferase [Bacteroidales bacterium]
MLSHNQIKFINSLKIKKYRHQHKAFFVEGEKGVAELFHSPFHITKVYALREWIDANHSLPESLKTEIQEITADELKKVSDLISPNLVLAIASIPEPELPDPSGFKSMALALDGIRDPGNMGTIIRTADWFGINKIICSSDSVDVYNPKVVQATMGSFSRVQVFYVDLPAYFSNLPSKVPVFGALLQGPDLSEKSFRKEGIILIGSESHGISEKLIPFVNEPVYIPHFSINTSSNQAESLNASIANGIICYEICKQLYKNNF